MIPVAPQFCVMCIAPAIAWVYSTVDQVNDAKNRLQEMTDVTKIKQKFTSYATTIGGAALNKLSQAISPKRSGLSAARVIEESKREGVDIHKEASIKADFVNLFLQYPTSSNKMKNAYNSKGKSIKLDMALEMYITADEMYKDLCGEKGKGCEIVASLADNPESLDDASSIMRDPQKSGIMLQLAMMESCFMEGKYCEEVGVKACTPSESEGSEGGESKEQPKDSDSEGDKEDNSCYWKANLDVVMVYDKIMTKNEQLVQLEQQYKAVMGISTLAQIKLAEEKSGDGTQNAPDNSGQGE